MATTPRKGKGLSADQAREILAKNPKLRSQGKDTSWVLERANQARGDGGDDADAAWLALDVDAALAATQGAVDDVMARLDQEAAEIEARRREYIATKAREVFAWFKKHDPAMASERTRAAVKRHQALLRRLGFRV